MDNIQAYKIGFRDANRYRLHGYDPNPISHREVCELRPSLENFTEAYQNGWEDAAAGKTWLIEYLRTHSL